MYNITIATQFSNGKAYNYYSVRANGKRHRFKTKAEAQAFIKTQKEITEQAGGHIATLVAKDPSSVAAAIYTLERNGFSIEHLHEAVKEYVKRKALKYSDSTFLEVAEAYLKHAKNRLAQNSFSGTAQAVMLLVGEMGEDANPLLFTPADFSKAMENICEGKAPATFNAILRRLKVFAGWAERNEYPMRANSFDAVDPKHIAAKEPRYIRMDEMRILLEHVLAKRKYNIAGLIALSYFAGIRTAELVAMQPEDFHFWEDEPYVRVSTAKGASYGRHGRIVPLERAATHILRAFFAEGEVPRIDRATLAGLSYTYHYLGIVNHNNIARHSFITYHIAKYNDENKTVTICGTSKDMAARHYKGLATKSQAEEYFDLPFEYL
jgi:integrase